jgi:CBS domain-containing protein
MSTDREGAQLPVATRQVLSRGGVVYEESEVFCPIREGSLTVEECARCRDFVGRSDAPADADDVRGALECRGLSIEAARRLPRARGPQLRRDAGVEPSLAERTRVTAIMASSVLCVREDVDAGAVAEFLLEEHVSGLPVVDGTGRPIGVISKTDLLRDAGPRTQVAELMTPLVFFLPEEATVAQAAALMAYEQVHRLPVLSPDGKVVGLVTSLDVLGWMARAEGYSP